MILRKTTLLASIVSVFLGTATTADAACFGKRRCCTTSPTVCPTPVVSRSTYLPTGTVTASACSNVYRHDPCAPMQTRPRMMQMPTDEFEMRQIPIEVTRRSEDGKSVISERRVIEVVIPTSASPSVQQAFIQLQVRVAQNEGVDVSQNLRLDTIQGTGGAAPN